MRFRCDVCGQRYCTADEPAADRLYRMPCAACGGGIAIGGGDYPALPTTLGAGPVPVEAGDSPPIDVTVAPLALLGRPSPRITGRRPARYGKPRRRRSLVPVAGAAASLLLLLLAASPLLLLPRPSAVPAPAGAGPGGLPAASGARPSVAPTSPAAAVAAMAPSPTADAPSAASQPIRAPDPTPPATAPARPAAVSGKPGPERALARSVPRSAAREPRGATRQAKPTPGPGLGDERVAGVVLGARGAFRACAEKTAGTPAQGRATLSFTVTPAGSVASPALDDPRLRETPFGRCLLDAARRLVFPSFQGEPLQVGIPLVFSPPGS